MRIDFKYRKTVAQAFIVTCVLCLAEFIFVYFNFPRLFKFLVLLVLISCFIFIVIAGVISAIIICITLIIKRKPNQILITFTTSMLTIVGFFIISYYMAPILRPLPRGSDLKYFNSELWKLESSIDCIMGISEREKMLKDLIKNILPEKTEKQIIDLLGVPSDELYFRTWKPDMLYFLGPQRDGFVNIDSEWLLIWLDDKRYFKKYRIAND